MRSRDEPFPVSLEIDRPRRANNHDTFLQVKLEIAKKYDDVTGSQ